MARGTYRPGRETSSPPRRSTYMWGDKHTARGRCQPPRARVSIPPAEISPVSERLRLYLVLAALTVLGPFAIDMYLPGLPALALDPHASESASPLTLTACLIGLAVGQLMVGPLSDSLGRRPPLIVGLVGYSVASLLCAV